MNGTFKSHVGKNPPKIEFSNKALQRLALTHSSYAKEHPELKIEDNERLEFLGDSVLHLIITNYLFKNFPESSEGQLSNYRSGVVSKTVLAEISEDIGLDKYLRLGRGQLKEGVKPNILADALEAFLGALFLDKGYQETENFVTYFLLGRMNQVMKTKLWHNSKSILQEKSQKFFKIRPVYMVVNVSEENHYKIFEVNVLLQSEIIGTGTGHSKKEAEQESARDALKNKGWSD